MSAVLSTISAACQAQPKVKIEAAQGEVSFQVEVAATSEKREVGLMYRRELPADRGMLFIFPAERVNSFWMKNTPIPLDMIFIGRERKIVGIVHETVPFSLDGRSVSVPSQYVLEINGGLSRRYGFKAGDGVKFDNVTPESVRE
ncbi:MAG TPA: DUF192 domain-containing protein [Candidatus Polarisedimenticolaceae bacterium]|nr:DUF192 domain-containing protein [Candidatus Polarisedimenticolaceae bacterium]